MRENELSLSKKRFLAQSYNDTWDDYKQSVETLLEQGAVNDHDCVDIDTGCGGFLLAILKEGVTREDVHIRLKSVFQDNPVDVWDSTLV